MIEAETTSGNERQWYNCNDNGNSFDIHTENHVYSMCIH